MRVAFQGSVVTFPGGKRPVTLDTDRPVTVRMMLDHVGKTVGRDEEVSVGGVTIHNLDTVVESGCMVIVDSNVDGG